MWLGCSGTLYNSCLVQKAYRLCVLSLPTPLFITGRRHVLLPFHNIKLWLAVCCSPTEQLRVMHIMTGNEKKKKLYTPIPMEQMMAHRLTLTLQLQHVDRHCLLVMFRALVKHQNFAQVLNLYNNRYVLEAWQFLGHRACTYYGRLKILHGIVFLGAC